MTEMFETSSCLVLISHTKKKKKGMPNVSAKSELQTQKESGSGVESRKEKMVFFPGGHCFF